MTVVLIMLGTISLDTSFLIGVPLYVTAVSRTGGSAPGVTKDLLLSSCSLRGGKQGRGIQLLACSTSAADLPAEAQF